MCAPVTLKKPQANVPQDAWGDVLSGSDGVPGGMPYRFVGAYGVRYDSTTGLHYMRNRWYDGSLQRFAGRDLLQSGNRYAYSANRPTTLVDVTGLAPAAANPFAGTNIVIYTPPTPYSPNGFPITLDVASIQRTATRYDFGSVQVHQGNLAGNMRNYRGYDQATNTLYIRLEDLDRAGNLGDSSTTKPGYVTISVPEILKKINEHQKKGDCPRLTQDQLLTNIATWALKHEIFNHEATQVIYSQTNPTNIGGYDDYSLHGTLNSGSFADWANNPDVDLGPAAPLSVWRRNHGLP